MERNSSGPLNHTELDPLSVEFSIREITPVLRGQPVHDDSMSLFLKELLSRTDSRAVGLWRVEEEALRLLGFAAKPDMPPDVPDAFARATRQVPLAQTGLGIVKAIVNRGPAIAYADASTAGLADSASWLAKFQAVQSLAVPIFHQERIAGVLAMSTANPFARGDEVWNMLTSLAEQLGQ